MNIIEKIANEYISKELFPGCCMLIGNREGEVYKAKFGTIDGEKEVQYNTLYDLASLTKIVGTLPAVLLLLGNGEIDLEDDIKKYLPVNWENITIKNLLTHTSGIPPYSMAYKFLSKEDLIQEIYRTEFLQVPNYEIKYSCLNFILLKKIVDTVTGDHVKFVTENVYKPLKMDDTVYSPGEEENVAPTSIRDGKRLIGMPDDELAFYIGGISGNAGLFSTLDDLSKYCREILSPRIVFTKSIIEMSSKNWTENIQGNPKKGLGWSLFEPLSPCGPSFSGKSFGHTGFTGTFIWIDPIKEVYIVILTNKCFYKRHEAIAEMRTFRRRISTRLLWSYERGDFYE